MPVEFRPIEVHTTWRNFPRHPAGEGYGDLDPKLNKRMQEGIEKFGVMNRAVILRRESGGMYVLDGWQMYQACMAAEFKPEFVELVGGISPEDYVEIVNDFRRHETKGEKMKRLSQRTRQLKQLVAAGESVKDAGAALGITKSQAYRDLTPVRCEKCTEKGTNGDDCVKCQLMRMDVDAIADEPVTEPPPKPPKPAEEPEPPPEPETPPPPPAPTLDANFVIVPEYALDAWRVAGELSHLCHELDGIAKRLGKIIAEKVGSRYISVTAAQRLQELREHMWQARATYVCAYCQGHVKEDCHCRGQGWLSRAAFAQVPKEMQDEMRRIGARNVPI